jgi:hypothetical protein
MRERIAGVRECVPDLDFGPAELRRAEGMVLNSGDDDFHAVTGDASRPGIGNADLI